MLYLIFYLSAIYTSTRRQHNGNKVKRSQSATRAYTVTKPKPRAYIVTTENDDATKREHSPRALEQLTLYHTNKIYMERSGKEHSVVTISINSLATRHTIGSPPVRSTASN